MRKNIQVPLEDKCFILVKHRETLLKKINTQGHSSIAFKDLMSVINCNNMNKNSKYKGFQNPIIQGFLCLPQISDDIHENFLLNILS